MTLVHCRLRPSIHCGMREPSESPYCMATPLHLLFCSAC